MRMIGLIGGMSWESTAVYYQRINDQMRARLGGLHSAEIVLRSVNFRTIVSLQQADKWDEAGHLLSGIGQGLQTAGADCLLICTNTMHKLADHVQDAIAIPVLHIVDVTAKALKEAGARKPLLLGTRYTMEQDFYRARLRDRHGIEAIVPEADDRDIVHNVIFDELCQGIVSAASRQAYLDIIASGQAAGADSVILGCTEIGLLISAHHFDLPVFDSTLLHADAAVQFALAPQRTSAQAA